VCVSGGKDSLVLWDVLIDEGYETEGLYIDLGIDGYSDRSKEKVLAYAASRGKMPIIVELAKEGIPIPEAARCVRMQECSICGTVKRYFFNRVAAEGKFTVVATGHNLDDETAGCWGTCSTGSGTTWRGSTRCCPGRTAARAQGEAAVARERGRNRGVRVPEGDRLRDRGVPMSEDATSLVYKEALSRIEDRMPGTRIVFYQGFLDPSNPLREGPEAEAPADAAGTPQACATCGAPTYADSCSFCRLRERVGKARSLRAARVSR